MVTDIETSRQVKKIKKKKKKATIDRVTMEQSPF